MVKPMRERLDALFKTHRARIERALEKVLPQAEKHPGAIGNDTFNEAVRHAVKAGGKRIRPVLTLLCAKACGATSKQMQDAVRAAVAIELLHSYTLVHDDLPAMDNDTLRRGEPTVWAKYGESTAILVGDYLQALAFEQLNDCEEAAELYFHFAHAAKFVIRGQISDIAATKLPAAAWTKDVIDYVFFYKTALLISTACMMGGYAVNAPQWVVNVLREYGMLIGIAFQYVDDVLDADQAKDGNELSALALVDGDKQELLIKAEELTLQAIRLLRKLPGDTSLLFSFANLLMLRQK